MTTVVRWLLRRGVKGEEVKFLDIYFCPSAVNRWRVIGLARFWRFPLLIELWQCRNKDLVYDFQHKYIEHDCQVHIGDPSVLESFHSA